MRKYLDLRKVISFGLIVAFLINSFGFIPVLQAQELRLPVPGVMVHLSPEFNPPILKGLKVHPENPLRFDFILDTGDSPVIPAKAGIQKLIKYFLASLTIPEKDLWVNLSPYEKNRIIPQSFGLTEMGRDLLAEDYMLKQITASLIYPEGETGKKFWARVYQEAVKKFGTTNVPVSTFNKVWIVPEKSVVYENAKAGTAYVVESKLKVMLEQDYLALSKRVSLREQNPSVIASPEGAKQSLLGSQIIREIIIPELTKEINQGKNFAQLRQVYNSLILATWYKKKIKDSILAQVYADKNKVSGVVSLRGSETTEAIYKRYLQAFKKGVYNFIKEENDPLTQHMVPRKYFSGGMLITPQVTLTMDVNKAMAAQPKSGILIEADISPVDKAMSADEAEALTVGSFEKIFNLPNGSIQQKLYRSSTVINGRSINITQYQNFLDETTPFLRVGKFIIIDEVYYERLDDRAKNYPFLIRKDTSRFRDSWHGIILGNADMNYGPIGWSGYLIGVLASMEAYEEKIRQSTFFDFGAGFSGILAVAAYKLGAAKIVLIDREDYKKFLEDNLTINRVPATSVEFEQMDFVKHPLLMGRLSLKGKDVVFVLDQPFYGAEGLPAILTFFANKTRLALVSGGHEGASSYVEELLHGAKFNVEKAIVMKGPIPPGKGIRFYTTLVATPKDAAMSGGKKRPQALRELHQNRLHMVLSERDSITMSELAAQTGIPKVRIWDDLKQQRFASLKQRIQLDHEERSSEEVQRDREAILALLKKGEYTRPELAKLLKKPQKQIEWDVDVLIKESLHPTIIKNLKLAKMVRSKESINLTPLKLEILIRQGITSIKDLMAATKLERSIVENTIHRNRQLKALRLSKMTNDGVQVEDDPQLNKLIETLMVIEAIDQILKEAKRGQAYSSRIEHLKKVRFKGVEVFTDLQMDQLARSKRWLHALILMRRILRFGRRGQTVVFTPQQAYAIAMKGASLESIERRIEWLLKQGDQKGRFLFRNEDIVRIILSPKNLNDIESTVALLREDTVEGEPIFNGYNMSLIFEKGLSPNEIQSLSMYLADQSSKAGKLSDEAVSRTIRFGMEKVRIEILWEGRPMSLVNASTVNEALELFSKKIPGTAKRMNFKRAIDAHDMVISINSTPNMGLTEASRYHLEGGDFIEIKYVGGDKAQMATPTGGIDFTAPSLSIKEGGAIGFKINPAMLEMLEEAPGFTATIRSIQPMNDLKAFLGLN